MFQRLTIAVIFFGFSLSANADVWRWTDMSGVVRYVTSTKALYTWSDEMGKVHYSDSPDHEDAIRVELVGMQMATRSTKTAVRWSLTMLKLETLPTWSPTLIGLHVKRKKLDIVNEPKRFTTLT